MTAQTRVCYQVARANEYVSDDIEPEHFEFATIRGAKYLYGAFRDMLGERFTSKAAAGAAIAATAAVSEGGKHTLAPQGKARLERELLDLLRGQRFADVTIRSATATASIESASGAESKSDAAQPKSAPTGLDDDLDGSLFASSASSGDSATASSAAQTAIRAHKCVLAGQSARLAALIRDAATGSGVVSLEPSAVPDSKAPAANSSALLSSLSLDAPESSSKDLVAPKPVRFNTHIAVLACVLRVIDRSIVVDLSPPALRILIDYCYGGTRRACFVALTLPVGATALARLELESSAQMAHELKRGGSVPGSGSEASDSGSSQRMSLDTLLELMSVAPLWLDQPRHFLQTIGARANAAIP